MITKNTNPNERFTFMQLMESEDESIKQWAVALIRIQQSYPEKLEEFKAKTENCGYTIAPALLRILDKYIEYCENNDSRGAAHAVKL